MTVELAQAASALLNLILVCAAVTFLVLLVVTIRDDLAPPSDD